MDKTVDLTNDLKKFDERLDTWVVRDEAAGKFSVDREVFTDEIAFELEMRHIFEGNWIYVAHESQVSKPNDFLTTNIGRYPVIVSRSKSGEIKTLLNVCTHRGARVCREKAGNKRFHSCPFHGWTYSSAGDLVDVTSEDKGAYPESFDKSERGLENIRTENYRGFIFASLNPDVVPLEDYLAGTKKLIDLLVDQSPEGELEVLRGATRYTYQGNWKLQAENGLDGYHVGTVHANYFMTAMRRTSGESSNDTVVFDFSVFDKIRGGSFHFENGHALLWTEYGNYKDRPNFAMLDELTEKYGETVATWMNKRLRNLLVFPNVFIMDQTSTQLRIIRPISVAETEVITYCIAPKGENADARALRIRQYEDFFNASGMATPDDLTEFNNSQLGFLPGRTNDMSRGAKRWVDGPSEDSIEIDAEVISTGVETADEALYMSIHEEWHARMKDAISREERRNPAFVSEAAE